MSGISCRSFSFLEDLFVMEKYQNKKIEALIKDNTSSKEVAIYVTNKHSVLKALPQNLTTSIGRIVIKYTYLENTISKIIYNLLSLSEAQGRIAIREPTIKDRIDMIENLLMVYPHDVTKPSINLKNIYSRLETVSIQRNQLVHSKWIKEKKSGIIKILITNSSFKPLSKQAKKMKRKIIPQDIIVTKDYLSSIIKELDDLISITEALATEISDSLLSSQKKFLEQYLRKDLEKE